MTKEVSHLYFYRLIGERFLKHRKKFYVIQYYIIRFIYSFFLKVEQI